MNEIGKDIKKTEKELQECEKQKQEYLAGWKRERADFLNFKKDETARLVKITDTVREGLILEILNILDNIYLAEKEIPKDLKEHCWVEGMFKIKSQIISFLEKQGVKEIDCLNKKFDPQMEEAIEHIERKDTESNVITEVIQKGYILNNKVIRPSKVRVSK